MFMDLVKPFLDVAPDTEPTEPPAPEPIKLTELEIAEGSTNIVTVATANI